MATPGLSPCEECPLRNEGWPCQIDADGSAEHGLSSCPGHLSNGTECLREGIEPFLRVQTRDDLGRLCRGRDISTQPKMPWGQTRNSKRSHVESNGPGIVAEAMVSVVALTSSLVAEEEALLACEERPGAKQERRNSCWRGPVNKA